MQYGFVYVLGNHAMPGLFKIGRCAGSPMERAAQLSYSTGVPEPFHIVMYAEVPDPRRVENEMHRVFGSSRLNKNREFFAFQDSDLLNVSEELQQWGEHFVSAERLNLIEFFFSRDF